jgi:putative hydrolase of the HAD superfamily
LKPDLSHIHNIIFDLGGVLINIDYERNKTAFCKLGVQNFDQLYSQAHQTRLFDDLETGRITGDQFRLSLKKLIGLPVSDHQIDQAWNAMLLDLPARRLALLKKLKERYRLFLLSNTNSIHIHEINRYLVREHGVESLKPFFEKIFYSYEIGMRKPDREVFEYVLRSLGIKAEQTLYIDDSPQHLESAGRLGIHTILLKPGEEVQDFFGKFL